MTSSSVVICGGGILGIATAYYLAKEHGIYSTILERSQVACAASGRAGGFLAKDWNDGSPTGELSRLSFELHRELATELSGRRQEGGVDVLYRSVRTVCVVPNRRGTQEVDEDSWLSDQASVSSVLGDQGCTAQVHPRLLTQGMLGYCLQKGCTLKKATVVGLEQKKRNFAGRSSVTGVMVLGDQVIYCDKVVIALGPWTAKAAEWLSLPKDAISAKRYHSIVLQGEYPHEMGNTCSFCEGINGEESVEIYPRSNGQVYVCGAGDDLKLPDDPGAAAREANFESTERLKRVAETVCPTLKDAKISQRSCCFLPISKDNVPLLGPLSNIEGCFIASGHGCWGVLNGPASGLIMADIIASGESKRLTDISRFSPDRYIL
eukprot:TRINITY_DN119707_c0_g1_i1.p1 TRINITY_DN119707_c0_g1~~TRINITY_DN119707_c0_g1_i1.p1  ORF type:complete len:377 (+),score=28.02 TRINITY_DN119707_c0_g1_i1:27-1157(+)